MAKRSGKKIIPEFTEDHHEKLALYAGYGMTFEQCARLLGVSGQTLNAYAIEDPTIMDSFELGKAKAQAMVSKTLFKRAAHDGDVGAIRWWETTRAGRAERTESEVKTTSYVIEAPAEPASDEDWEKQFDGSSDS